jgi:hypothetical protein
MIVTKILTGFFIGIISNLVGMFLCIWIFADVDFEVAFRNALQDEYIGKLIALGAALNFLPFFVFLKRNQIYHARGVLLATFLTAIIIAIFQII